MIRQINTQFGPQYYAVCSECKADAPCMMGQIFGDNASYAIPSGWSTVVRRDRPIVGRPTTYHYCPRCSVAPEYRKS